MTIEELREEVRETWEAKSVEDWSMPSGPHAVKVVGGKSLYYQVGAYSTVFIDSTIDGAFRQALEAAPKESLAELKAKFMEGWEERA